MQKIKQIKDLDVYIDSKLMYNVHTKKKTLTKSFKIRGIIIEILYKS